MFGLEGVCLDWRDSESVWIGGSVFGLDGV